MISVDDLVEAQSLTYLAGRTSGARLLTWAHACDLPDPWNWCEPGCLVMTTGLPDDPAAWVGHLAGAGMGALLLSTNPDDRLLATADEHGFPVLTTGPEQRFVTIARAVIEPAAHRDLERLGSARRLYDAYWQALADRTSFRDRLTTVERLLGWRIDVVDERSHQLLTSGRLQGLAGDRTTLDPTELDAVVPIPARRPALLVTRPVRGPAVDAELLQHLSGLVAIELEHQAAKADQLRASGAEILRALLDGNIEIAAIRLDLNNRGLTDPLVVVCWNTQDSGDLHHHLGLGTVVPLLLQRTGNLFGLMPDDEDLIALVTAELGPSCVAGISAGLAPGNSAMEAARQARLAMGVAAEGTARSTRYGAAEGSTLLVPNSVEDARQLVRRVLGPLTEYDAAHSTELTATLHVFLRNDRGLQRTAQELTVHRQTLVYRLQRAEELLGFKPASTAGTAVLWQAFTAARQAGIAIPGVG